MFIIKNIENQQQKLHKKKYNINRIKTICTVYNTIGINLHVRV